MKHNILKRMTALLLALVCVFGLLPLSALADSALTDAPDHITQISADFVSINGRPIQYATASDEINGGRLPFVFNEKVSVPGLDSPVRALCSYHAGTLGAGGDGQRWNFYRNVTDPSLTALLTLVYSFAYGDFSETGAASGLSAWNEEWSNLWFVVAQAATWYWECGLLANCNTNCEYFIEQVAQEFLAAYKLYHDAYGWAHWVTDWDNMGVYDILDSSDGGATGDSAYDFAAYALNQVLDHPEYFHTYHLWEYEWDDSQPWRMGSSSPMQRLLIAVPEADAQESVRMSIKKLEAGTNKPLSGVTFRIENAANPQLFSVTRTTGADGTITLTREADGLSMGQYTITEVAAPAGYLAQSEAQTVTVLPGNDAENTFIFYNTPLSGSGSIRKTDRDNPSVGLPGAVIRITSVKLDGGGSFSGTYTTKDGGYVLTEDLDPGVVEVWEQSVPDEYLLNEEHQTITLVPAQTGTVSFQNYPKSSLIVNKIDSITGDPIQGAKFHITYASNNTFTGEIRDLGTYFSDENGQISLSKLQDGWYRIEEVEPAAGYAVADPAVQDCFIQAGTAKTLTFTNTPLSALVIWKYDSVTGEAVEGAVFQVKYLGGTSGTGGTVIGTYVTSNNGCFTVTGLKAGTYIVSEVASDSGHVIDAASQTACISGKEQDVVQLYFGNSPKGSLLVKKVDSSSGKPLSDVEFMVTTSDGTVVGDANGRFVTDSAGTFTVSGITPGTTLVVKETRAKDGYLLDDAPQTAVIHAGQTVVLEFRNKPLGSLIIHKVDSVTGEPLAGVIFKIVYADGRFVDAEGGKQSSAGLYRTDKNGQIVLSGITGTLVVTEVRTLPGYVIDPETRSQTVTVNPDDTQVLTFYNTPIGGVEIIKVSEADRTRRLANVTFEIRRMDGGLVSTVSTDRNGRVYAALEAGDYYAVEIETAAGFQLDAAPHYFTVQDGKTTTLTVTNQPLSGILLHKVDSETKSGLYGVTFLLYDGNYNPIGQYTSDQDGYVYIDGLTVSGQYFLRELENPGYVLDAQLKTVYVTAGQTTLLEWENTPEKGQIQITKTSADYNPTNGWPAGTPIPGTIFELYDRAGNLVDTIQTDKNGVACSKPLPLGRYTVVESQSADFYLLDAAPMERSWNLRGRSRGWP